MVRVGEGVVEISGLGLMKIPRKQGVVGPKLQGECERNGSLENHADQRVLGGYPTAREASMRGGAQGFTQEASNADLPRVRPW